MIREKFEKKNVEQIAKELNVSVPTIYRWIREENIDNMIKFMEFLKILEIDIDEYLEYKKGMNNIP